MQRTTLMRHILPALVFIAWTTSAAFAVHGQYRIGVAGLACPFCAYGIEKKLNALEGVQSVETHIKEGVVVVTTTEGTILDEAIVRKAVEATGFTMDGFEHISGGDGQ